MSRTHTRQWNAFNGQKTVFTDILRKAFDGGFGGTWHGEMFGIKHNPNYRPIIDRGGYARNLLNAEERQGRSAGRFLLMNGIFEMFHFFSFRQPTTQVK